MYSAKDLIAGDNVVKTYKENKYICFALKNGIIVKLNPNEVNIRENEEKNKNAGHSR